VFERARSLRLVTAAMVVAATSMTACATSSETRNLEYGLGGLTVGAGVIGGALVGTTVLFDPRERNDDGSFVPVADQEGVSLWPWGVGIAVVGVGVGGALIAAGALTPVDNEKSASTTPAMTPATTTTTTEEVAALLDLDATSLTSPEPLSAR